MTEAGAMTAEGQTDLSRRKFLTVALSATAGVGAVFTAVPFLATWAPSERVRAAGAPAKFDLSKLAPGQMATIIWRKQPIYIVNRPPEITAKLAAHDASLKDPKSAESTQPDYARNEMRSVRDNLLVLIGTCTHLGCLPKQRFEPGDAELGADWPGGFYCPCHGSRFDLAGRVFNGSPASLNLRIPPYRVDGNLLTVGEDGGATQGAA
jgi:ubiquinol-cytochrome c reductase iron-sulfur subunit